MLLGWHNDCMMSKGRRCFLVTKTLCFSEQKTITTYIQFIYAVIIPFVRQRLRVVWHVRIVIYIYARNVITYNIPSAIKRGWKKCAISRKKMVSHAHDQYYAFGGGGTMLDNDTILLLLYYWVFYIVRRHSIRTYIIIGDEIATNGSSMLYVYL